MGKCDNCEKKILYNKYKRYRKQILCIECYNTRLERKAAKKAEQQAQAEAAKILISPRKKAKKALKKQGITTKIPDLYGGDYENEGSKAEE